MRCAAAVGALAIIVTGCGGSGSKPAASPAPPTPSPSPTVTVRQFASVIAQSSPPIRTNAKSIRSCAIGATAATTCGIIRLSSTLDPKTLVIRLQTVMQDGQPPTEIADLVQRTIDDARTAVRVAKSGAGYDVLSFAQNTLVEDLDAWRPYGG